MYAQCTICTFSIAFILLRSCTFFCYSNIGGTEGKLIVGRRYAVTPRVDFVLIR